MELYLRFEGDRLDALSATLRTRRPIRPPKSSDRSRTREASLAALIEIANWRGKVAEKPGRYKGHPAVVMSIDAGADRVTAIFDETLGIPVLVGVP